MNKTIITLFMMMVLLGAVSLVAGALPTANLVMHFEADMSVYSDLAGTMPATDGQPVASWLDQAALGGVQAADQSVTAYQPILIANALNGNPVIRFDGVDDFLVAADNITGDLLDTNLVSMFAVYKSGVPDTEGMIVAVASSGTPIHNFLYGMSLNAGNYRFWSRSSTGSYKGAYVNRADEFFVMSSGIWHGVLGSVSHWLNGIGPVTNSGANASAVFNQMGIGAAYYGEYFGNVELAALLIYNTVLGDVDREAVEAYLSAKYDLCNQPPTDPSNPIPSDGGLADRDTSLIWTGPAGAPGCGDPNSTYDVYLAEDAQLTNLVESWTGITETTVTPSQLLDPGTAYYWAVDAHVDPNDPGVILESPVWSFTTTSPPPAGAPRVPVMDGLVAQLDSQHVVVGYDNGVLKSDRMLDQSGNNNDAVTDVKLNCPQYVPFDDKGNGDPADDDGLNGYPVLRFDGEDDYLELRSMSQMDNTNTITFFLVFRALEGWDNIDQPIRTAYTNSTTAWGAWINGTIWSTHARSATNGMVRAQPDVQGDLPVTSGEWIIMEFWWDGNNVRTLYNGEYYHRLGGATLLPSEHVVTRLMAQSNVVTAHQDGELAELLLYNRTLSAEERLEVGYYLANKYGIDTVHAADPYFTDPQAENYRGLPPADCEEIYSFQLPLMEAADFNRNCIVDVGDLMVLASEWLENSDL